MVRWMNTRRVVIVGGGAAGFFAGIRCAEMSPQNNVQILEKGPQFLSKVRISGGGRCNVTHACFDARELSTRYPRGGRALIGPFQRFQSRDTVEWFESRGVQLKTEPDGRMFPVTDNSQTVIDCLVRDATQAGVQLINRSGVDRIEKGRAFELHLSNGKKIECDCLLLATGGCRTPAAGQLAVALGHTLVPPVPSLFTFHIDVQWLRDLAGISVEPAEVSIPAIGRRDKGAVLVTHWGLSGPAILRLSAWGARELHALNYEFALHLNWLPDSNPDSVAAELRTRRESQPARRVVNTPVPPLPARLWEQLVIASGIDREKRWATVSRAEQHKLVQQLLRTELPVSGKSLNKDEFVTCGGVPLSEVDFKTMESRICPGLYFAGEILDIDGITGGFNFQAAWTTGWIAGGAMAG